MGILSMLFVVFGWPIVGIMYLASKGKEHNDKLKDKEREEARKNFERTVCNEDKWLELCNSYKNEGVKEEIYKEYYEVLDSLDCNTELLRSEKYTNKLSFKVYAANRGLLDNRVSVSPTSPVFAWTPEQFGLESNEICKLYKWFDRKINSFYPEYYMVRYWSPGYLHSEYIYEWNVYSPGFDEEEKVADIQSCIVYTGKKQT